MTTTPNGFVELCGLWKRKDKETGKEVPGLTGKMGGARVLVVRNKNKTAGRQQAGLPPRTDAR